MSESAGGQLVQQPIRFLVDEDIASASVVAALERHGHLVYAVGDLFPKGTPDPALVTASRVHGLVIVTMDRDFNQLIPRNIPHGQRTRFRRGASRVRFSGKTPDIPQRIDETIEIIEFAYRFVQAKNQRLIMDIAANQVTFIDS